MSVKTDEVQLRVTINGSAAKKQLAALDQEAFNLRDKMKGLKKGTEEYIAANNKLKDVENKMSALRNEIGLNGLTLRQLGNELKKLTSIQKDLTPGTKAFKDNAKAIADVKDRMAEVKGGTGLLGGAFKSLGKIIETNPLLFLASILLALWEAFKQNNTVMELMERITAVLGTAVGFLMDKLVGVGKAMIAAFSNPRQALSDLADFVKQNLINRFTAFGLILEGILNRDWKKIRDGAIQAGTGVENLYDKTVQAAKGFGEMAKAQYEITEALQKVAKEERRLQTLNITRAGQVDLLISKTKDLNLAIGERQKALEEANAIEIAMSEETLKLQQEKLRLMQEQSKFVDDNKEEQQKIADQESVVAQLQVDHQLKLQEIKNKGSKLDVKEDKEAAAREAKKQKAIEDLMALEEKLNELRSNIAMSRMSEQAKEEAETNLQYDKLKADAVGHTEQLVEIELLRGEELAAIRKKYEDEEVKSRADAQEEIRVALLSEGDAEIDAAKKKWQTLIDLAKKNGLDTEMLRAAMGIEVAAIIEKQNADALLAQGKHDKKELAAWKAKLKKIHDLISSLYSEIAGIMGGLQQVSDNNTETEINNINRQTDAKKAALQKQFNNHLITQAEFDKKMAALDEEKRIKEKAIKEDQWKKQQNAAIATAIINTALSVVNAFATAPNFIVGAVFAALAAAAGAVQIAAIESQPMPEFEKGVEYVDRGKNPRGVDTIPAYLNEGERIVPADVNAQLGGIPNRLLPKLLNFDVANASVARAGGGAAGAMGGADKMMYKKFDALIAEVSDLKKTVAKKQNVLKAEVSLTGRSGLVQKQAEYDEIKTLAGR